MVLEKAVLRGPRPQPGTAGLVGALAALCGELEKLGRKEQLICIDRTRVPTSALPIWVPPPASSGG